MPGDALTNHVTRVIEQIERAPVRPLAQPAPDRAYRIEGEPGGEGRFVVPSKSVEGIAWLVDVLSGRRVRCRCIGFQTRNGCRHALATRAAWDSEQPPLAEQLERSVAAERFKRMGVALRND